MLAVCEGRDSVLVLPTGGGKSICFQAPALLPPRPVARPSQARIGVALVVSPLIALMKDQVDGLRVAGVDAAYLNSSQTPEERDAVLGDLRADRVRLLYVSPERLVGEGSAAFRQFLQQGPVRYVAIDEAHCISQWGHDFRPEYRQLGTLRDQFSGASFHAFTATATERVRQDIVRELRLETPRVLVGSFDRPNLTYRVLRRGTLRAQIGEVLARHRGESGIIYCPSRREVESLAERLRNEGVSALPYHAGLDDAVRARHQDAFIDERVDIIVATVAFGMGIDRSNVRFVIHTAAPRSPEHYQQEAGRAGRDGLPAECVLLYSGADFARWRQMLEANGELSESSVALLRMMNRYVVGYRCRHRTLVEYFGEPWERGACDACDVCLREVSAEPVEDAVTVARKILSCVARVGQSRGTAYVCDLLLGHATPKVLESRHDQLSTFGLLRDETAAAVRGFIEQLLAHGWLDQVGDPYPVLGITSSGASLLKGATTCELYRERQMVRGRDRRTVPLPSSVSPDLFNALRQVRARLARERGVPPYVVFHDTTLLDMAARRPATLDELLDVKGVGERKAAVFGQAFLDAIRLVGSTA